MFLANADQGLQRALAALVTFSTPVRQTNATTQNTNPGSLPSRMKPNSTGAAIPPKLNPVDTKPKTFAI